MKTALEIAKELISAVNLSGFECQNKYGWEQAESIVAKAIQAERENREIDAHRAGKYEVWENLSMFFEGEAYSKDATAQFILKWADEKMKTHGEHALRYRAKEEAPLDSSIENTSSNYGPIAGSVSDDATDSVIAEKVFGCEFKGGRACSPDYEKVANYMKYGSWAKKGYQAALEGK